MQRKRHEFILAISKGLVPPETPPGLRKHRRRKYSMETEDVSLYQNFLKNMKIALKKFFKMKNLVISILSSRIPIKKY